MFSHIKCDLHSVYSEMQFVLHPQDHNTVGDAGYSDSFVIKMSLCLHSAQYYLYYQAIDYPISLQL